MKRILVLLTLVIGLMLLFGSVSIVGAEDLPDAGDAPPAATVEAVATLAVIAPDGTITPVSGTVPAAASNGALSNPERAFWVFVVVILILVIVAMAIHYNAQIKDMVSPQTARSIYNDAAGFLNGLTRTIPGEVDDLAKNVVLAWVDDRLKQWETARSTTININAPSPSDPAPPAPGLFTDSLQAPG